MTRWTWKQHAACCMGALVEGDVAPELFAKPWRGRASPLFWRIPILLWSIFIIAWSEADFWGPREMFFVYMTNWGLILIMVESLFGVVVTIQKHTGNLPDATFGLPWYVKTYWVLYNISIPVSFMITVFYWCLLRTSADREVKYAPNPVLDVMLHGVNSVVMLVELLASAHPSRLLHILHPLYFALVYVLFSVTYYNAGGLDPWGHSFIYPVIDWSKPQQTMVVVTLTALFLALMHILTVGIATVRDMIARKCFRDSTGVYNDGFDA
ncbi:protein rolling stone-like isoform X2 [Choristoneura fumiferana]|uniref:protein rolling stone-like isoform X2 n=1 Tax=Choristoneura fumiferana TaxID=7141 RepID=UPI003D157589